MIHNQKRALVEKILCPSDDNQHRVLLAVLQHLHCSVLQLQIEQNRDPNASLLMDDLESGNRYRTLSYCILDVWVGPCLQQSFQCFVLAMLQCKENKQRSIL